MQTHSSLIFPSIFHICKYIWFTIFAIVTHLCLNVNRVEHQSGHSCTCTRLNWHESHVSLAAKTWLWLHAHLTPQLPLHLISRDTALCPQFFLHCAWTGGGHLTPQLPASAVALPLLQLTIWPKMVVRGSMKVQSWTPNTFYPFFLISSQHEKTRK